MMNSERAKLLFVAAAFAALALLPLFTGAFAVDLVTKIMVYAVFALSLELLVGSTGLVCFGQAAFFGIGAYATVLLTPDDGPAALWWLLPLCVLAAAAYALAVGALSLRTKGVYFIMVTLAFAQMAYYVVHDTPLGGGTDGIYLNSRPTLFGLLDLDKPLVLYGFTLACLVVVFGFLAVLLRSRFGRALAGIKVNEQRMRATGFSTYPYKLAAFTVSGGIAGLAGFLFAVKDGFVNPELLSWHFSGAVLIMIILGGLGHLRGALIGAFAFALLQEFFKSEAVFGAFAKHWSLGLGLSIIASVALLPRGLVGLPGQWRDRLQGRAGAPAAAPVHHERRAAACAGHHPPLGRPGGGGPCLHRSGARPGACRHRHQRRGQVHAHQHPVGRIPALQRPGAVAGAGHHALAAAAPRPRRPGPQLPAQHHISQLHGV
jgi:branched-chain amino acid transport system permease protein